MTPQPKIFISYRRSDAGGHARQLFDRLQHWLDAEALFFDESSIDAGERFPARMTPAAQSRHIPSSHRRRPVPRRLDTGLRRYDEIAAPQHSRRHTVDSHRAPPPSPRLQPTLAPGLRP